MGPVVGIGCQQEPNRSSLGDMKVPIACTLSPEDAADRVEEWRSALVTTVTRIARLAPARAELRLVGEPGDIAMLVNLTQREKACCELFGFAFEVASDAVTLVVSVPNDAVEVLDGFTALVVDAAEPPG
jgi:hypothetical protein